MNAELEQRVKDAYSIFERVTKWIGSISSVILHTCVFGGSFALAAFGYVPWESMLLILTTLVSLEAIYLSIFIQMTVNRHQKELQEVSEDVEDIQEDVEDIQEDIQEISEDVEDLGSDVEDIQEDIEELAEDETAEEARKEKQLVSLEQLTADVKRVLADLESLKRQK